MMTIKTILKPSSLHGMGIFAEEFIPKGTVIWKFNSIIDRVITTREFLTLPMHTQDFVAHYSYKLDDIYVFCGDDGKYFNHSDTPNTDGVESPDGYGMTLANRNIDPGEEITCDYREFDDDLERKKTENQFV